MRTARPAFLALGLFCVAVIACAGDTGVEESLIIVERGASEAGDASPESDEAAARFDEWWAETHRSRSAEDVVVLLPESGEIYLAERGAEIKHLPSGSYVTLWRGVAEARTPDGEITVSDTAETLFGQRFEIARLYQTDEGSNALEAALRDPTVMTRVLSTLDPAQFPVTRRAAIRSAWEAFKGGAMKDRFTPLVEPRDPLAVLLRWNELKDMPGGNCDGYVVGPNRMRPDAFRPSGYVWFVQMQGGSRSVSSPYEYGWSNVIIDAETGLIRAECRSEQPRRIAPLPIVIVDPPQSPATGDMGPKDFELTGVVVELGGGEVVVTSAAVRDDTAYLFYTRYGGTRVGDQKDPLRPRIEVEGLEIPVTSQTLFQSDGVGADVGVIQFQLAAGPAEYRLGEQGGLQGAVVFRAPDGPTGGTDLSSAAMIIGDAPYWTLWGSRSVIGPDAFATAIDLVDSKGKIVGAAAISIDKDGVLTTITDGELTSLAALQGR